MSMNEVLERATNLVARLPPVAPRPRVEYEEIVALLQEPSALFGEPSSVERPIVADELPVDWEAVAADMYELAMRRSVGFPHVVQILQLAAQVLKAHDVRICRGLPKVEREGTEEEVDGLSYEIYVDVDWRTAWALSNELFHLQLEFDLQVHDLSIGFIGEWTAADEIEACRICRRGEF